MIRKTLLGHLWDKNTLQLIDLCFPAIGSAGPFSKKIFNDKYGKAIPVLPAAAEPHFNFHAKETEKIVAEPSKDLAVLFDDAQFNQHSTHLQRLLFLKTVFTNQPHENMQECATRSVNLPKKTLQEMVESFQSYNEFLAHMKTCQKYHIAHSPAPSSNTNQNAIMFEGVLITDGKYAFQLTEYGTYTLKKDFKSLGTCQTQIECLYDSYVHSEGNLFHIISFNELLVSCNFNYVNDCANSSRWSSLL